MPKLTAIAATLAAGSSVFLWPAEASAQTARCNQQAISAFATNTRASFDAFVANCPTNARAGEARRRIAALDEAERRRAEARRRKTRSEVPAGSTTARTVPISAPRVTRLASGQCAATLRNSEGDELTLTDRGDNVILITPTPGTRGRSEVKFSNRGKHVDSQVYYAKPGGGSYPNMGSTRFLENLSHSDTIIVIYSDNKISKFSVDGGRLRASWIECTILTP